MDVAANDIAGQLRKEILLLEGYRPPKPGQTSVDLGPVTPAFPNNLFPTSALHEFISMGPQTAAATSGFTTAIVASLMKAGGACIWIAREKKVFPPGLIQFGIAPERVIFLQIQKEKDLWWAIEEALQHRGVAAVIGETRDISLTASRRLQLAIERSGVTGFLLRDSPRSLTPIACVARWRIRSLPSRPPIAEMPGVSHPRWDVEILKIKNGKPGSWQLEWANSRFRAIGQDITIQHLPHRKTG